jgi:hypothetical protein
MTDKIRTIEEYRMVGIQDCQPQDRIETVVKPAIDHVMEIQDPLQLYRYLEHAINPPEARLLAHARLTAIFEIAAEDRSARPNIDMERALALVAALNSRRWRWESYYCSMFDHSMLPHGDRERLARDPEWRTAVERDKAALRDEERRAGHG